MTSSRHMETAYFYIPESTWIDKQSAV